MQNFNTNLDITYLFYSIYQFLQGILNFLFDSFSGNNTLVIKGYFISAEILLLPALIYAVYKLRSLRKKEKEDFLNLFVIAQEGEKENHQWWDDITDHIASDNSAQWTLALIDADKILEDALRDAGYQGVGVGELLKDAEAKHGFRSLQEAWEAHKVRNRIAHETGFELTKRDAKNSIERYKTVFQELGYL